MQSSNKVQLSGDVQFTKLDNDMVLMDIRSGKYYSLNSVGARVWELLNIDPNVETVLQKIREEFDCAHDTADRDVQELIRQLADNGLISVG